MIKCNNVDVVLGTEAFVDVPAGKQDVVMEL